MIGLYSYRTNNIGDDFQSHVLKEYLGSEVEYVWRDGASEYDGPVQNLIINGFITEQAIPIASSLNSIFLAAWLGPKLLSSEDNVSFLSGQGAIGCRDTDTFNRCQKLGLDCYFTGCPTILCDPIEEEVPGSVLLVDINPRIFESGVPHFRTQTNLNTPITWATNIVPYSLSQSEREDACRIRHRLISSAELVITNRIHIALPALGMGKALIFISDAVAISGRLTALPENVKQWNSIECSTATLDPSAHRYDVDSYKANVRDKVEAVRTKLGC